MRTPAAIIISLAIAVWLVSAPAGPQASGALAAEPVAASAQWQVEAIPSPGRGLAWLALDNLSFDAVGHGMLTWIGCCVKPAHQHTRSGALPEYVGADVRDPTGGWHQVSNPAIQSTDTRTYLYGNGRAQQIGSDTVTTEHPLRTRSRVLYADGSVSGNFRAPRTLDQNGGHAVSAADAAGDAIVAWTQAGQTGTVRVADRTSGHAFSAPLTLAELRFPPPVAVAIDARGDRVVAWATNGDLYARLRGRGRAWGPAQLAAHLPVAKTISPDLSVAINHSGTIALAWATVVGSCEECTRTVRAGIALEPAGHRGHRWRNFTLENSTVRAKAPGLTAVIPEIITLIDTEGRTYVTWNGTRGGSPAVKLARITAGWAGTPTTLSTPVRAAMIRDAAAGPRNALIVTWSDISAPSGLYPVYASLRRANGRFAPAVKLTPPTVTGGSGLVAFQPTTGEAMVVFGVITSGHTELQASISPPG